MLWISFCVTRDWYIHPPGFRTSTQIALLVCATSRKAAQQFVGASTDNMHLAGLINGVRVKIQYSANRLDRVGLIVPLIKAGTA